MELTSYGIFAKLAEDCVAAAERWEEAHKSAAVEAGEAPDYRAQLLAWAEMLHSDGRTRELADELLEMANDLTLISDPIALDKRLELLISTLALKSNTPESNRLLLR